jgi:hypothetical protein
LELALFESRQLTPSGEYTSGIEGPALREEGNLICRVRSLQVANLPIAADQAKQRALLVLMGKRVGAQTRPSANLADYLESAENRNLDGVFEQLKVGVLSNDRFISISKNP